MIRGLETATRTGEAGESLQDTVGILPQPFGGRYECGGRVEQVVSPWYAEVEAAQDGSTHPGPRQLRVCVHPGTTHVGQPHVGISHQSIGDHPVSGSPDHFTQVARTLVVRTGHEQTVGLHGSSELGIGGLDRSEGAIEVEVVGLHISDDGDLGPIDQEGPVTLVGLGDEDLTRAVVSIGTVLGELTTDGERRVDPTLLVLPLAPATATLLLPCITDARA